MNDLDELLIRIDRLKLVLANNEGQIGRGKWYENLDSMFAAIGFWLAAVEMSGNPQVFGLSVRVVLYVLAVLYTGITIWRVGMSIWKRFDSDTLLEQILQENEFKVYPHSIAVIRDTFNKIPNRFLVYYDVRWGCLLFPNFHTIVNHSENVDNLRHHLSSELKLPDSKISCAYSFEKVHKKWSSSHGEERYYRHWFYDVRINAFSRTIKQDQFTIDGKTFRWMSIAELENDSEAMHLNSDVIGMVKANF